MRTSKTTKVIFFIIAAIVSITFIFPFVWMMLTAVKPEPEVMTFPPKILPSEWKWHNFVDAWNSQAFGLYTFNSLLISFFNILGQVISGSLAAYAFAKFDFKGKTFFFMLLLGTMMLPWDVTVIPQYMQFNMLGWIDTLKPLIVPALFGSAYYIYLMRQYVEQVSNDFSEAAKIDGANEWQIYSQIYMPMMKPVLALVAIQTFVTCWNDYLGPLVFLNSRSKYTLALGLASFKGVHETAIVPTMCIAVVMCAVPIAIYLLGQAQMVEGITAGGVKG